jgi:hypothetical protein
MKKHNFGERRRQRQDSPKVSFYDVLYARRLNEFWLQR